MPRQKETLTLSVPPGTKERLEAIALRFNITWGKSPSPSGLVTKIAQQELEVGQPFKLTDSQVTALRQAIRELVDTGHIEEAKSVITLLIDRGDLEAPLRQDLIQQVSQSMEGWRIQVDHRQKRRSTLFTMLRSFFTKNATISKFGAMRQRIAKIYLN
jgi:hypothetical protein